ncbi:MAG TPA: ATP-dependent metallopeptidase FtsH/Yme1/Tma family protein, partial [Candidatus Binatia bacterium]
MALPGQQTRRDAARGGPPPPQGNAPAPKMPPGKTWLWLIAILAANYLIARILLPGPEAPITVPYTLFKEEVGRGNVESIYSRGDSITGRFKKAVTYPPPADKAKAGAEAKPGQKVPPLPPSVIAPRDQSKTSRNFATALPSFVSPDLESFLIDHGVEISAKPIDDGGSWTNQLLGFLPALLFIGFYVWIFRRAAQ